MNLSKDKNVHAIGSMYSYGVDAQTGLEFIYEDKKYQGCFHHKYGDSKNVNEIILSETYYIKQMPNWGYDGSELIQKGCRW